MFDDKSSTNRFFAVEVGSDSAERLSLSGASHVTIALSLKVNDGVVLAADSATTLVTSASAGSQTYTVYNNAVKVFNLRKGLPIGAMIWGLGSIGSASLGTLLKDLRTRFSSDIPEFENWKLGGDYTVEGVANRVFEFLHGERLTAWMKAGHSDNLAFGVLVAGFSPGMELAELWTIEVNDDGSSKGAVQFSPSTDSTAIYWNGQPEAIYRLYFGISAQMPEVLKSRLGIPDAQIAPAIAIMKQALQAPLLQSAMPIQDAIDLGDFLADVSAKFSRFALGPNVVGGTIELAAITKHEGFKWVRRKFYYDRSLNPEEAQ